MSEAAERKRNPNLWVPSLYYTQGFPYTLVTEMGQVFFKAIGAPLEALGIFQAALQLPWALKFLWSPLVDLFGAKRNWILAMQVSLTAMMFLLAADVFGPKSASLLQVKLFMPNIWLTSVVLLVLFVLAFGLDSRRPAGARAGLFAGGAAACGAAVYFMHGNFATPAPLALPVHIWIAFLCFLAVAVFSATHDISIDGYYLDVLDSAGQAAYSGVRVAAYRAAMVVGGGLLVMLAGKSNWALAFCVGALLFLMVMLFHFYYLPRPAAITGGGAAAITGGEKKSFARAFTTYLDQKRIVIILLFILLYRVGDFLWKPMAKPFLMDIGVSVVQIGVIQGVLGMIATILGSIAGGIYIAKRGLTRGLWVLGIIQSITLLLYAYLALRFPKTPAISLVGIIEVATVNVFENLAYGLGTIAFVNFLMRTCKKEYTSAHYAIATGLMALASTIASVYSGFLAQKFGYTNFFVFCFISSVPGLFLLALLPLKELEPAK
ncbi:MAG TPA: hypothetical protein PLQ76_00440 [bacterium]|nr:hypothetical protein [bacterium]